MIIYFYLSMLSSLNTLTKYDQYTLLEKMIMVESLIQNMTITPRWELRPDCCDILASIKKCTLVKSLFKQSETYLKYLSKLKLCRLDFERFFYNFLRSSGKLFRF